MYRFFLCFILLCFTQNSFAQVNLREYVGLISVADHPDLIAFVDKIKTGLLYSDGPLWAEEDAEDRTLKIPPYEHPVGSGFLFKANDGNTYILTNWHVIMYSWSYSITFEHSLGEVTVYSNLTLIAADEEIDLALLAFDPDNAPEREGLSLLDRPIREGEEVFSAGFPALGNQPVWQFSRGQISNAQVMLPKRPWDEDDQTVEGPFIQHTSPVDPGNSGGPLLVADTSSPLGYLVVGVNARSAFFRQAANYSIPVDAVQVFMHQAFHPVRDRRAERQKLDQRLEAAIKDWEGGFFDLFDWLSYQSYLDNAEYAYYRAVVKDRINGNFGRYPTYILMWALEELAYESLPFSFGSRNADISILRIEAEGDGYKVNFLISGRVITTSWVLEQGAWRIASVGRINGDKTRIAAAERSYNNQRGLRSGYWAYDGIFFEGGYGFVLDRDTVFYGAFGSGYGGLRFFYADSSYWQLEIFSQVYLKPLRFGVFALETNYGLGMGIKVLEKINNDDSGLRFGISPQLGIELTSSLIRGLYLGANYQYNLYYRNSADANNTKHLFVFLSGYRFGE